MVAFSFLQRPLIWLIILSFILLTNCSPSSPYSTDPEIIQKGEEVFNTYCANCHDMAGDRIGPSLGGITQLVSYDWMVQYLNSPKKMIDAGDERAQQAFEKYQTYMPDFNFLDKEEVTAVLSYIHEQTASEHLEKKEKKVAKTKKRPMAKPVFESGINLVLSNEVTIPFSSDKPPLARIANMRTRPGSGAEFYVNDQRGIIYRIKGGHVSTFLDLRKVIPSFVDKPGLGTGLGCFAFHPDFEKNGLIYITHTEKFEGQPTDYEYGDSIKVVMQWVLSEWKMDNPSDSVFSGSRREMLRVNEPTYAHGFQDFNFVRDIAPDHPDYGLLYLGSGDGASTIRGYPQLCHTLNSPLGKIMRIDPMGSNSRNGKYGIPETNPFASSADPKLWKEIWAYGFRNPHHLSWTKKGDLIASDVGESSFEELNLIQPGNDYGWNVREGNHLFDPAHMEVSEFPAYKEDTSFKLPLAQFDHYTGAAVCGGYEYQGPIAQLQNKYIFGDIPSGKIFYIELPVNEEVLKPIYQPGIEYQGKTTTMQELTGSDRVDLRFGEDGNKNLWIMSKADAKIRLITQVSSD